MGRSSCARCFFHDPSSETCVSARVQIQEPKETARQDVPSVRDEVQRAAMHPSVGLSSPGVSGMGYRRGEKPGPERCAVANGRSVIVSARHGMPWPWPLMQERGAPTGRRRSACAARVPSTTCLSAVAPGSKRSSNPARPFYRDFHRASPSCDRRHWIPKSLASGSWRPVRVSVGDQCAQASPQHAQQPTGRDAEGRDQRQPQTG